MQSVPRAKATRRRARWQSVAHDDHQDAHVILGPAGVGDQGVKDAAGDGLSAVVAGGVAGDGDDLLELGSAICRCPGVTLALVRAGRAVRVMISSLPRVTPAYPS